MIVDERTEIHSLARIDTHPSINWYKPSRAPMFILVRTTRLYTQHCTAMGDILAQRASVYGLSGSVMARLSDCALTSLCSRWWSTLTAYRWVALSGGVSAWVLDCAWLFMIVQDCSRLFMIVWTKNSKEKYLFLTRFLYWIENFTNGNIPILLYQCCSENDSFHEMQQVRTHNRISREHWAGALMEVRSLFEFRA